MEELSPVKMALLEVRTLRARLDLLEKRRSEPIAITGLGLRLPGGIDSPEGFWELLRSGGDAVTEVPGSRWDNGRFFDADFRTPGKVSTRHGSFLKNVDQFDAAFFGISPREAENMDPQHRLLLEVTWEALERAGQAPAGLMGSNTGVFVGISNSDYQRLLLSDLASIDPYVATGNLFSLAAGRLAYTLGLHGPNVAVDTACSSSLVAVHQAVQSLRQGECDLALAGGVSLMLSPAISVNFSKAQMMAADGRCKTFDAAADGYVRGEGCIVIVLKRLAEAVEHGDPILAVIRGSAINHDGRSGGLTAPNGPAQTAVIRAALANAGVQAQQIGYVETHGTGTALGDPIEVQALVDALARERAAGNPLRIGSVKTNLGHLEAAAGLAGLLKGVLCLQHKQIPPHLHLRTLNPHIDWGDAPVEIPTQLTAWEVEQGSASVRMAGVSAFGLSGTNAFSSAADPFQRPARAVGQRHPRVSRTSLLRIAGFIRRARDECAGRSDAGVLVLAGGDDLIGGVLAELAGTRPDQFHCNPAYRLYSLAGVDARGIGNHDLDWGLGMLSLCATQGCATHDFAMHNCAFPLLSANLKPAPWAQTAGIAPSAVLTINGLRVAVIGLTTQGEIKHAVPGEFEIGDPIPAVLDLLPGLRAQSDLIVVLSHLGRSAAERGAVVSGVGDVELATALPPGEVQVIVGSHTHTILNEHGLDPANVVNGAVIVQAGSHGRYVGEVVIDVTTTGVQVVDARLWSVDSLPEDPEFESEHVLPLVAPVQRAPRGALGRGHATRRPGSDAGEASTRVGGIRAGELRRRCTRHPLSRGRPAG